ncbi:hypothetical protein EAE91_20885 [Photorhabdus noenieputensis]|nr:hypothetical protein [Photorhabdus noenieputensis]
MLAAIHYQQLFQNSYLNSELNNLLLFIIIEMMRRRREKYKQNAEAYNVEVYWAWPNIGAIFNTIITFIPQYTTRATMATIYQILNANIAASQREYL